MKIELSIIYYARIIFRNFKITIKIDSNWYNFQIIIFKVYYHELTRTGTVHITNSYIMNES